MRIAHVAPLFESVPPKLYGGTERVVHYLVDAQVRLGHEVHVFASGDSTTTAPLHAACARALRLDETCLNPIEPHVILLEMLLSRAHQFDIVHFHTDLLHLPAAKRMLTPSLSTLHGRLDLPNLPRLYRHFESHPFVSISDRQRLPLPFLRWAGTVLHGLPPDLLEFHPRPGTYLAFLGRICEDKGIEPAIEIAGRAGIPLRVAAKVDAADRAYYERIRPLLEQPGVEFIGEISESQKAEFLGNAAALLFPICWPEPFGLVMIEAMATGTPVIAYGAGSVPEVVREGVSGFIVHDVPSGLAAVARLPGISRRACRDEFEARFTSDTMARAYLKIYQRVLDGRGDRARTEKLRNREEEKVA